MKNNKLYSIFLSVLVALALWLYVVTNVSQEDDRTYYNVPVVLGGETILGERNLMVTDTSAKAVSLNITGPRSELNKISSSSNLAVRVDLTNINDPGSYTLSYSVIYPGDATAGSLAVQSRSPVNINVSVDYRRTKEVPVSIKWTGSRSENHLYDTENAILDYPSVTLSGPAAVVDTIDRAIIEVDLTDRVESFEETYRYSLCSEDGTPVDAGQVTTNAQEIRLEMPIRRLRDLELVVNVVYGGAADESNTVISVSPDRIRVTGSETVLSEIGDSFTVGTVNLAELTELSNELTFQIALPEGVTNQTGVFEAVVTVAFQNLRTMELPVDTFQIWNVPEGLEAEVITENLNVLVRGSAAQLRQLTGEDLWAEVDFTGAEAGTATYRAKICIRDTFDQVGVLKTYSVSARLQELTAEAPQETVPEEIS